MVDDDLLSADTRNQFIESQHEYVIICLVMFEMKLLIHSQTSTVQPLMFENG